MSRKKFIFLACVISFLSFSLFPMVEVVGAKSENVKLAEGILVAGEITIKDSPITLADIITGSLPDFLFCDGSEFAMALGTSRQLYVFAADHQAVSKTLPLKDVNQIIRLEGTDDLLISHWSENKSLVSRYNMPSGKILWSYNDDFVSNYFRIKTYSEGYGMVRTSKTVRTYYHFPTRYVFDREKNQLCFAGLVIGATLPFRLLSDRDSYDWGNRILVLDAAAGKALQNTYFDLQRNLDGNLKFFVSLERKEFQIVDMERITALVTGKFSEGDLLAKKGFAAPIDMRGRAVLNDRSDLWALLTEKELIVTTNHSGKKMFSTNMPTVTWVKFDLQGRRLGPLTPIPKFFIETQIRNQGKNKWPLIFRRGDSLFIMDKEGQVTTAPMPEIGGDPSWFLDDQNIYGWTKGVLYRAVVGESEAVPVYTAAADKKTKVKYDSAPDGEQGIVMLSGAKGGLLVRLSDGQPLTMAEALRSAPARLFWAVSDASRLAGPLPQQGLPETFKGYADVGPAALRTGSIETYQKDDTDILRLWGEDPRKELGDIALVPALLKDGSSVLFGIGLPQNEVLFWVPLARIKGLDKDNYREGQAFLFAVKHIDQKNAWLVLAEKLNTYKVYSITRPAMPAGS